MALWTALVAPAFAAAMTQERAKIAMERPVPTVTLLGEKHKTIGVFRDFVNGDRACYVTLTDDNGEPFRAVAAFTLCERGKEFLGKRARLRYGIARVLAAACGGDMDCDKSDTVALIEDATVLPPAR